MGEPAISITLRAPKREIRKRNSVGNEVIPQMLREIAALRRYNDLSAVKLGKLIEVGQPVICSWETGKRFPQVVSLFRMAHLLDVDLNAWAKKEWDSHAAKEGIKIEHR